MWAQRHGARLLAHGLATGASAPQSERRLVAVGHFPIGRELHGLEQLALDTIEVLDADKHPDEDGEIRVRARQRVARRAKLGRQREHTSTLATGNGCRASGPTS